MINVCSVVDLLYKAKRDTKSFELLVLRTDSDGNEISSVRDIEGE